MQLALLGDPVEHSLSPSIHAAALAATGIVGEYRARRVDPAGLVEAVDELRRGALHGANITMPYKQMAAEVADDLHPDADRARSANTLFLRQGEVFGASTDIDGIRMAWGSLPDGPVLILGSGGAAAAALLAVEGRPVSLSARNPEAADRLLDWTGVDATALAWGTGVSGAVVVNATPLGTGGGELPATVLDAASGLFDMPYGKQPTHGVLAARKRGIPVVDGLEMLIAQAGLSFEMWTGIAAPIEAMRAAVADDHSRESNL